ncbi:MAG TPA: AbrB/MazE/SpoVT family DNA-binding domain-containing protein [Acidimicrobiales bacterium]
MTHAVKARVTSSGQISLPADVRRRWAAKVVVIVDAGDRLVVRPAPDDPIGALRGKYASTSPSSSEMRAEVRAEEARREASAR